MAKKDRVLPERLEIEFAIADEGVNRNGWRLIVAGIQTENFEKNPVCVVQHNQWMVPVGRWTALKKENGSFKGTLEFDRNDEQAVALYWKYKDGFMNAVSLNIHPLLESEDKKDLLPGQRYKTVVESDLLEISLVTIPAYGNSVKLSYGDGREYKASLLTDKLISKKMDGNEEKTVEQLQAELSAQRLLTADTLIKYHKYRGVVTDGEVEHLKKLAQSDYASVSSMLEARQVPSVAEVEKADPKADLADGLAKLHAERGAITEAEKAVYRAAAMADYDGTKKILEAKPGSQQAKDFVAGLGGSEQPANERASWTYLDWYKNDLAGLQAMEKSEPERHQKLVAELEKECKRQGVVE